MHDSICYTDVYIYIHFARPFKPIGFQSIYILKVDGLEWTCDDRIYIYKLPKNNAQNAIASESIAHGQLL